MKAFTLTFLLMAAILLITSCTPKEDSRVQLASGGPGDPSFWTYAGKTGIGTSYELPDRPDEASTSPASRVWFSLARGMVTETAFGMIHEAQIKDIRLAVIGNGFVDFEDSDMDHKIEYLYTDDAGRPLSLAYKQTNTDKEQKYLIEKYIYTDPSSQSLVCRLRVESGEPVTPVLIINPHMNNTGSLDSAFIDDTGWHATEKGLIYMSMNSSRPFEKATVGFAGSSGIISGLKQDSSLASTFQATDGAGNVLLAGQWPASTSLTTDVVIGFGPQLNDADQAVRTTFERGLDNVLKEYNGENDGVGWEDYLATLDHLKALYPSTGDQGRLLNVSAMVLKAMEDKEHPGGLIASLSIPWGDSVSAEKSATGYRAVWPRDFYQCAMAYLALGDEKTPLQAFRYLKTVQVNDQTPGNEGATGWFLQKTVVNGDLEWVSVQMDQTAMPIMLGWKLWKKGILPADSLDYWYTELLHPAAEFLTHGGKISLDWNHVEITPPFTQQERWEEQAGYSPSTMAAIVTGLRCAADIARAVNKEEDASTYSAAADKFDHMIESTAYTTRGKLGNGKYFIRISKNPNPNDHGLLGNSNGRTGMEEDKILDGGFLELVRYGIRRADDPVITNSVRMLDDTTLNDTLRVKYYFQSVDGKTYEGWRRYGNDGYGEDAGDGSNYGRMGSLQRGRVWPFFTGEHGHYMLRLKSADGLTAAEKQELIDRYVKAMEYFANEGMMLPEQVWDGVGSNDAHHYALGEGTSSATPLAWTHAEYIKLVRSISDGQVWDDYPVNGR